MASTASRRSLVVHISEVPGPRGGESWVLTLACGHSVVRPKRRIQNAGQAIKLMQDPNAFGPPEHCKCNQCLKPDALTTFVISGVAAKVHGYAGVPGCNYEGTLRGAKMYSAKLPIPADAYLKIEDEFGLVAYRFPAVSKRSSRGWVERRVNYEIPNDRPILKISN